MFLGTYAMLIGSGLVTIYAVGTQIGLILSFFSFLNRGEGGDTTIVPLIQARNGCTGKFF